MKRSKALELDRAKVLKFQRAFESYASIMQHDMYVGGAGLGVWHPVEGTEDQEPGLRAEVDLAAGGAARVARRYAPSYELHIGIGNRVATINAITEWRLAFDSDGVAGLFTADHVRSAIHRSLGRLEDDLAIAKAQERSLAGRVARVLRFPFEVRDAMNVRPKSVSGVATVGFGYALYLVAVGAAATVVGALILRLF